MRYGKIMFKRGWVENASQSELRTLFSNFYPVKIAPDLRTLDNFVYYGYSPLFAETERNPGYKGYPCYEPIWEKGEYGKELAGFKKTQFFHLLREKL